MKIKGTESFGDGTLFGDGRDFPQRQPGRLELRWKGLLSDLEIALS
jgi:hypothetical protein